MGAALRRAGLDAGNRAAQRKPRVSGAEFGRSHSIERAAHATRRRGDVINKHRRLRSRCDGDHKNVLLLVGRNKRGPDANGPRPTRARGVRWDAASAQPISLPSSSGRKSISLFPGEPFSQLSRRHRSSRLSSQGRPCRHWPCRESGATGWQCHGPIAPADRSCWQTTRTFARGCPCSSPVSDFGQCRQSCHPAGYA